MATFLFYMSLMLAILMGVYAAYNFAHGRIIIGLVDLALVALNVYNMVSLKPHIHD